MLKFGEKKGYILFYIKKENVQVMWKSKYQIGWFKFQTRICFGF